MEFYGLLGEKLSHSLSPKIHKEVFEKLNIEGGYKIFEVKRGELEEFTKAIKILKVSGFNVTIPYKEEIIKYLDFVSEEVKKIGAVNTVKLVNDKLYGYNTDYYGFGYMLDINNVIVENKVAAILGNGGACKAALYYLLDKNIKKVYIVSRNVESSRKFNDKRVEIIDYNKLENINGDILINSTPVGMHPNINNSPVEDSIISNFNVLVDLIYNPMKTEFLIKGDNLNKKIVGGLYMLLGQGIKAQEIWQEVEFDSQGIIEEVYCKLQKEF